MALTPVTVSQYQFDEAHGGTPYGSATVILDTSTNLSTLTTSDISSLLSNNVDEVDSTNNLLSWNVAQWQAVPSGLAFDGNDLKIVADTGADIANLTTTDLGHLNTYGVTEINPSDGVASFTAAQYGALGGISFDQSADVTISDTGANIASLSAAQFGAIAVKGIDHIDATDDTLSLNVNQAENLNGVTLDGSDTVILADTGAHIAALSAGQLTTLSDEGFHHINATDNVLSLTVAQFEAIENGEIGLAAGDHVTMADTGANLSSLTSEEMAVLDEEGIDQIDAKDNAYSLTVNQAISLASSGVDSTSNDVITVADSGAQLQELGVGDISLIGSFGVDVIDATDNAVSFSILQLQDIDDFGIALTAADTVTLFDTAANIDALSDGDYAAFAANHVDIIDASDNGQYNVDEASIVTVLNNSMSFDGADTVVLADTGANIQHLSATQFSHLAAAGVDRINATDDALALTTNQYNNLDGVQLTGSDTVTIRDTGAKLGKLDFSTLAANHVDALDATDNVLALTVAQFTALGSVSLAAGDVVTLADTGAHIAAMNDSQLVSLGGKGVDVIDATDNALSLTVHQFSELGSVSLTLADTVTIADSGAHISGLSVSQLNAMNADGVDILDANDNTDTVNAPQLKALGNIVFAANDYVTLYDTGVDISGISGAFAPGPVPVDFSKLAAEGIDHIDATDDSLFLNVTQYGELGTVTLTQSDYVTEYDTGANIASQSLATLSGLFAAGIDQIDASDDVLNLSVAQFEALDPEDIGKTGAINPNAVETGISLTGADTVTLVDTGANLASLSAAQIGELGFKGVDFLDASDNVLTLSEAQFNALGEVGLTGADFVTIADTGAHLSHLNFAALAADGVDQIDATDNVLSLTKNQVDTLVSDGVALTSTDTVTMRAAATTIEAINPDQLAAYAADGVDIISSIGQTGLTLSAAQTAAIINTGMQVDPNNDVTLSDSGTNVIAKLGALFGDLASSGIDHINLTDGTINISVAQAEALGTIQFDSSDNNVTLLDTAANIEALTGNQIYAIGNAGLGVDTIDASDGTLTLDTDQVGAAYDSGIRFEASNVVTLADIGSVITTAPGELFFVLGEEGIDVIDATDNKLILDVDQLAGIIAGGISLTASDHVVLADTGADLAQLTAADISTMHADLVDLIRVTDGEITLKANQFEAFISNGYTFAATDTVTVNAAGSGPGVTLAGGIEHDALNGGGGNDVLSGGQGADTIFGGGGADQLSGGGGADTFVFTSVTDSAVGAEDRITDLQNGDVIDLSKIDADTTVSGNQAFHIVSQFDGHAGELMIKFNSGSGNTIIKMDTNGDGIADSQIIVNGDHHDFTNFIL